MNYRRLIISLALPQLAGAIGSLFTISAVPAWYASLAKPSFNPPSWLFGPVWVMLYFLMGVSIYLVWQEAGKKEIRNIFWVFWLHLAANAIWSIIFFGLQSPLAALVDIIILWLLIVYLVIKFWSINKIASVLLWPYLLWVSFAAVLNYFIWYLN